MQFTANDDSDGERQRGRSRSPSGRHTFPPRLSYSSLQDWSGKFSSSMSNAPPQSSASTPRLLKAFSDIEWPAVPSTSRAHSRRLSLSGDNTPRHHAPMVGSYEESILRGRMSTLPSKPFHFIAQIGVLGKGDCKPALRCPSHISLPFHAVYYSYGQSRDRMSSYEGGPSPYVGLIDLENHQMEFQIRSNTPDRSRSPEKLRNSHPGSQSTHESTTDNTNGAPKRRRRAKNESRKAPQGAYRIPQQGQLQIIIKTVDKTAVKLFLVPYNLAGMIAGQKTFIRQRSYSAGPIIQQFHGGSSRQDASSIPEGKHALRYLVHLHFCCTSESRYYLYKTIRVVFANRVPDGKEYLKTETQLPEPRYSTWRPESETPNHSRQSSFNMIHSQLTSLGLPPKTAFPELISESYSAVGLCPRVPFEGMAPRDEVDDDAFSTPTTSDMVPGGLQTERDRHEPTKRSTLLQPAREGLLTKGFGKLARDTLAKPAGLP